MVVFVLNIAGGSIFFQNNAQILALLMVLSWFIYKNGYKINILIIDISIYWVLLNFVSILIINNGQSFSLITIFSRLVPLFIAYFIVKLSGSGFYNRLMRHVYVLAIISLPLFLIQFFFPSVMFALSGLFNPITRPEYSDFGSWYNYFFMFNAWHLERNSGFMWEPGAFAGMLVFLITYHLANNNFSIDKYIFVFLIALLTTFSTAGYLALGCVFFAYYLRERKRNFVLVISIPLIIIAMINLYLNNEFLYGKIETYLELGNEAWGIEDKSEGVLRTSRLGYWLIILDESLNWPFGHGIIDYSNYSIDKYGKMSGPGALSNILHQWGWIGLLGVVWFIYKFYCIMTDNITAILFTIAMGIILFSNPWNFLMLIYSIIAYYRVYKNDEIVRNEEKAVIFNDYLKIN